MTTETKEKHLNLSTQRYHPVAERAELIEGTPFAHGLNWDQVQILAKFVTVAQCEKDTVIFAEAHHTPKLIGLVVSGQVEVIKHSASHGDKRLGLLGKGKSFGEVSMIDGQPHSASVIATAPTTLLLITKESLDRLLDEVPRLGSTILLKLSYQLCQRLRQASGQLVDFLDEKPAP